MRWCRALAVTMASVAVRPALAEPDHRPPGPELAVRDGAERTQVAPKRRALAVGAAIVPGIFVRGTGSYLIGEKRVAKKLALLGLGGVVVAGGAGAVIGLSGANPYTTVAVPLVVSGAGAFLTSWASDLWIAAGGGDAIASPRARAPWSVELGQTWQHDAYRERLLGRAGGRVAYRRLELATSLLASANGDAWVGYVDGYVRVLGAPASDAEIVDGSKLDVRVGSRVQRDDDDRVSQQTAEVEVIGRLDLSHVDRALGSTFVEGSVGTGLLRTRYADMVTDVDSLLLGRFAWGIYLPGGELALYYDHRRDGIAGGIAAYRAASFVGSAGAALDVRVAGPWAIRGELQYGNAVLTTLAFAYRGGGR